MTQINIIPLIVDDFNTALFSKEINYLYIYICNHIIIYHVKYFKESIIF